MSNNALVELEEQLVNSGYVEDDTVDVSYTELAKRMSSEEVALPWYDSAKRNEVDEGLESIYEIASAHQMTILAFVREDPEYAVMCVEMSYAKWTNVLTQAALTGSIETDKESVTITKNQVKALELRVKQAKYELDYITDLALSMSNTERKRDHLLRVLYMNAVMHRDTRALIYLMDRNDGRPGESRVAEFCFDNAYNIYMILHTLFDMQLNVLNAGNGTILVCCSRRAGKTHMLVAGAIIECLRLPNTTCIYIGETAELTEGLVDDAMNKIIAKCHLQDKRGKRFNWRKMDNGSQLLVRGLSNTKDPDQIRGKGAKVIVIDEFFHLKAELLEYLQDQVLTPMQMDYADDYKFLCAGTPPSIKGTFGEKAWKEWDVPHFSWTWEQNPHPVDVQKRREFVEKQLEDKGLTWDMPFVRREYKGEWAYDDDLVLYPNYKVYDPNEGIPQWPISRILFGIDYGCSDNDCIIGIAWSDDEGKGYEMFECKFNRLDILDRNITQLEYLKQQVMCAWSMALEYFPYSDEKSAKEANKRILWDADDNDQHVTQELGINCKFENNEVLNKIRMQIGNAHKTDKVIMWDKIDELMRTGKLLLLKDGKAAKECESTVLKRGPNGEIYKEVDDKLFHPDLLVAMRYALYNAIGV